MTSNVEDFKAQFEGVMAELERSYRPQRIDSTRGEVKVAEDEQCPICFELYGEDGDFFRCKDGIENSEIISKCRHWCCVHCWQSIYNLHKENDYCPLCREDITDWLKTHYASEDEDEEEDDDEERNTE